MSAGASASAASGSAASNKGISSVLPAAASVLSAINENKFNLALIEEKFASLEQARQAQIKVLKEKVDVLMQQLAIVQDKRASQAQDFDRYKFVYTNRCERYEQAMRIHKLLTAPEKPLVAAYQWMLMDLYDAKNHPQRPFCLVDGTLAAAFPDDTDTLSGILAELNAKYVFQTTKVCRYYDLKGSIWVSREEHAIKYRGEAIMCDPKCLPIETTTFHNEAHMVPPISAFEGAPFELVPYDTSLVKLVITSSNFALVRRRL